MRAAPWLKSDLHIMPHPEGGAAALRAFVAAAEEKGMESLCFVRGTGIPFVSPGNGGEESTAVGELARSVAGRLRVASAMVRDRYAPPPTGEFDLCVGAVGFLPFDESYVSLDDREGLLHLLAEGYSRDPYRLARDYFRAVAELYDATHCELVGEIDPTDALLSLMPRIDPTDPRYLRPALEALEELIRRDVIFEVRTDVLPGHRRPVRMLPSLLGFLAKKGGRVALASGATHPEGLCRGAREAAMLLRAAGFGSVEVLRSEGWRSCGL